MARTSGRVSWDTDILGNSIQKLRTEQGKLKAEHGKMKAEQGRVDASWKSPVGRQYQSRLQNDVAVLDNILTQLGKRTDALQKVHTCYTNCEQAVKKALDRLPK